MKRLFLVLALFGAAQSAFALSDTAHVLAPALIDDPMPGYGLGSYQFTPYRRGQLQGSLYLNGSRNQTRSRSIWDHRRDQSEVDQLSYNLGLNPTRTRVGRSSELLMSAALSANAYGSLSKANGQQALSLRYDSNSRNENISGSLAWDPQLDWDAHHPTGFRGGLSLSAPLSYSSSRYGYHYLQAGYDSNGVRMSLAVTDLEQEQSRFSAQAVGSLRAGYGRIVAVEAAWKAARLVQALAQEGQLTRALEAAESQALAELCLELQAAYPWNARAQRLAETRRLHAFFAERGLLEAAGVEGLLLCADAFDYPVNRRGRGWQALVEVFQGVTLAHWSQLPAAPSSFAPEPYAWDSRRYQLSARFERPLNLEWQSYGQAAASLLDDWVERTGAAIERQSARWDASLEAGLSFHPGTRFSLSLSDTLRVDAQHQDIVLASSPAGWVSRYDERIFRNSTNFGLSYQSSFATTVSLNATCLWTAEHFSNEVYAGNPTGVFSDAFDPGVVGLPVSESVVFNYYLSVSHRFR